MSGSEGNGRPYLIVTEVSPDGAGKEAGLKVNDALIVYNSQTLHSNDDFGQAIIQSEGGGAVELVVLRDDELVKLTAKPGKLGVSTSESNSSGIPQAIDRIRAQRVLVTTAPNLEGYRVTRTIDVVTAECVFGMNAFRDLFATARDVVGGRSVATQKVLRDARKTCLDELRLEALNMGANAVIAVDLDYSELSGGGKSMLFLVASGTAVIVE